jgi:hypothetical protein
MLLAPIVPILTAAVPMTFREARELPQLRRHPVDELAVSTFAQQSERHLDGVVRRKGKHR